MKFTIFLTGDIHGRDVESARLYSTYKRIRSQAEKDGRRCLFFDAGDTSDRRVDYCGISYCSAYSPILNAFGYDAMVVGNDIGLVYGLDALKAALSRINAPVLGSNFRNGDEPVFEGLRENIILDVEGIKIGLFGLTNPWGKSYEIHGLHFPDIRKTVKKQIAYLKEKGSQIIIMLSHLGLNEDLKASEGLDDIDFILGGHSHSLTPGGVIGNDGSMIFHSGQYAEHLGRIDFEWDKENGVINKAACVYQIQDSEEAPEILQAIAEARIEAENMGSDIIGKTTISLDLDYWTDCKMGHFTADALCSYFNTDIAMVSAGTLHGGIEKGDISLYKLSKACFAPVNPCLSSITGAAIREALEKGMDEQLNRYYHTGLRGTPVGIPQLSGIIAEADLSRPVGERITTILIGENTMDENKTYTIAHTDLESSENLGFFPHEGWVKKEHHPRVCLREVLFRYLQEVEEYQDIGGSRWIIQS